MEPSELDARDLPAAQVLVVDEVGHGDGEVGVDVLEFQDEVSVLHCHTSHAGWGVSGVASPGAPEALL